MGHAYAERYATPEEALVALKRGKTLKLAAAIAILVGGVIAMLAFSAAMYSDEPNAVQQSQTR